MPLADAASYPPWLNVAIFTLAAGLVWLAGTRLARYAAAIGDQTGLEQAFAGMLLLGCLTSLPEVANVVTASHFGNPALAVNNLLGSAAINVVLLAVVDTAIGRQALTAGVARSSTLMLAALCMLVLALVAAAVTSGDIAFAGVGLWSAGLCVASIGAFWLSAAYGGRAPWVLRGAEPPVERDRGARKVEESLPRLLAKTAAAAAVILVAGYALSQTGDGLARQTGLGAGLVGFLLIGFATSLPELSTLTAAIRMRRNAMALGEVLGTNFVNISLILVADLMFTGGPVINELGSFEVVSALLGLLLTGIYLIGLLEHRDRVVLRMGYDSLAVIVVFVGGAALLFTLR
jgi:cation:H+ antiporter